MSVFIFLFHRTIAGYYFPTLLHYQYEVEYGKAEVGSELRYLSNESLFPNYSMDGYAIFSSVQVILDTFFFLILVLCDIVLFSQKSHLK